jgi:pimeloyl-ACP methyl ester carboxylesterase
MRRIKLATAVVAIGAMMIGGTSAGHGQDTSLAGQWDGAIAVLGSELPITVHFAAGDTLTATIDIPAQGAMGLPLRNVSREAARVYFELMGGPGLAVFDGRLDGDSIGGTFAQAGVNGTFGLRRATDAAAGPSADDEPLPYGAEEVTFTNGDITLAGTLTLPAGEEPHPAAVLITGSGAQDRDESVFGMQPFRLLADHLTRAGIAVLRYDDRGVGGSSGNVQLSTTSDFADDALAGVAMLKSRPDIDAERIGLIGHSEGGIVAPIAANQSTDVAFIVLLAGTAVSGAEILVAQAKAILEANGADSEQLAEQERIQRMTFAAVRADTGWDNLRVEIERQIRRSIEELPVEQRSAITDIETMMRTRADQQLIVVRTPWFRSFLDYDPATTLRAVRVPVLAVFGALDLQVPPSVTLEPMRAALAAAPTDDVTIEVIEGANHLFQAAATGSPNEYASLPKEFTPGFAELLSNWVLARVN